MIDVWHCQTCRSEGYTRSAAGVGHVTGLRAIGWFVDVSEAGEVTILCPSCHPRGYPGAIEQARAITSGPILTDPRWREIPADPAEIGETNTRLDALEARLGVRTPDAPPVRKKKRAHHGHRADRPRDRRAGKHLARLPRRAKKPPRPVR